MLQGVTIDLLSVKTHVEQLIQLFQEERDNSQVFSNIFELSQQQAKEFDIEIKTPKLTQRQTMRPNVVAESAKDYFRISIFIPYLDSFVKNQDFMKILEINRKFAP